jgi:hypothetical protein
MSWFFVGLIAISALSCPAMMLISMRRGQPMSCCMPSRVEPTSDLKRRQSELAAEIDRRDSEGETLPLRTPAP